MESTIMKNRIKTMPSVLSELKLNVKKVRDGLSDLSFDAIVRYFYQPTDPSSLGIIRFLFGLLMVLDITEERGGADIDLRYGDPRTCHFPLFPFIQPLSFPYMTLVYGGMWLGALGIMFGLMFRISVFLFAIPYWYLLLLDKSFWNNHSYLYGLVTVLLMGSSAHNYLSFDSLFNRKIRNAHVPYWNYFILKYQFFMLYFLAGLKKTDLEWLEGYSMTNLGEHWVFLPFKLILSTESIDYLIVHWTGFLLDLTVGFWMLMEFSRPIAMVFCSMFHLMNSRLFSIGNFPYVCLATLPLFCHETWPKKVMSFLPNIWYEPQISDDCIYKESICKSDNFLEKIIKQTEFEKPSKKDEIVKQNMKYDKEIALFPRNVNNYTNDVENKSNIKEKHYTNGKPKDDSIENANITNSVEFDSYIKSIKFKENIKNNKDKRYNTKSRFRQKFTTVLLLTHCVLQIFLPYSHFLTKGFNNWTHGLYGYSWDMMVHSWDTVLVVVKVVDNESGLESFMDDHAWTLNDRWNKHGDMCLQYAKCIKNNLLNKETKQNINIFSTNLSIYIDVWCSLNKRFQQRMFNPNYDLLNAKWSPFQPIEWLMPVLTEYNGFRSTMNQISQEVYAWNNESEVLFVADFPGMFLENYIGDDIRNVSITVLEGEVIYEVEDLETEQSVGIKLKKGDSSPVVENTYHKIHTIGSTPSSYMYTFQKASFASIDTNEEANMTIERRMYSSFPLIEDFAKKRQNLIKMWTDILNSLKFILFKTPLSIDSYNKY